MLWDILSYVLVFIYVIDCLFMGLVIMMQRSKQEGLGAAFGGGFTDSVWGAQTSNVLVKATVWATVIFFILSITLARIYSHRSAVMMEVSPIQQELLKPIPSPTKPSVLPPVPSTSTNLNPVPAVAPKVQVPPTKTPAGK